MIDDKKIEKAARQISEKVVDTKCFDDSNPTHLAFAEGHFDGFNAGAKWAINELLKELWHPASEKPILRNGKCLVVYNSGKVDMFSISFVYEILSNYGKDGMGWKCWAYVLDLFPKEGGNHD